MRILRYHSISQYSCRGRRNATIRCCDRGVAVNTRGRSNEVGKKVKTQLGAYGLYGDDGYNCSRWRAAQCPSKRVGWASKFVPSCRLGERGRAYVFSGCPCMDGPYGSTAAPCFTELRASLLTVGQSGGARLQATSTSSDCRISRSYDATLPRSASPVAASGR